VHRERRNSFHSDLGSVFISLLISLKAKKLFLSGTTHPKLFPVPTRLLCSDDGNSSS